MTVIKAVVKNGKIELDPPRDWAEGTEVLIEPVLHANPLGLREEDWPDTPEAIARHLALMDTIEPLEFTEAEAAEWDAGRAAHKDFQKARFEEQAETLLGQWE